MIAISVVAVFAVFLGGLCFFQHMERTIADLV